MAGGVPRRPLAGPAGGAGWRDGHAMPSGSLEGERQRGVEKLRANPMDKETWLQCVAKG